MVSNIEKNENILYIKVLYTVWGVPCSLFRDEGSFWIIQDSTKHLFDVCVQLSNTSVWVQSIVCPVISECSAKPARGYLLISDCKHW